MANFAFNLLLMGSLYFLSLPILITVSWTFASYSRNKVVSLGSLGIQTLAFVELTTLFSERGRFYQISALSNSVLPTRKINT